MNISCEILTEVDEQMTLEENNGNSTIEVMEDGEVIWNNVNGMLK